MRMYDVPTLKELARRAGMAEQSVWAIAHAKYEPTYMTLRRLHEGLGCTWEELMEL